MRRVRFSGRNLSLAQKRPEKDAREIMIVHSVARTADGKSAQDVINCWAEDWPAIQASDPRFSTWATATFGLTVIAIGTLKMSS